MAEQVLDPLAPPALHLLSAFLAMEPTDHLLALARACGGGQVTEGVQRFVWDHCINKAISGGKSYSPYLKSLLKKLIMEVESKHGNLLDEIYEQYTSYMTLLQEDNLKQNARVSKIISFLFPGDCFELPSYPRSGKLMIPLKCSLNMLEGDTGCTIWPSSLFLSELILSFPEIFCGKSCLEVGSGVGLVGICLAHVKESKVILSDGDLSTLANLKLNLDMNNLNFEENMSGRTIDFLHKVRCVHLPWEFASESELKEFAPDIILGADVLYDPSCLPHLVRVLAVLLSKKDPYTGTSVCSCHNPLPDIVGQENQMRCSTKQEIDANRLDGSGIGHDNPSHARNKLGVKEVDNGNSGSGIKTGHPVAYLASVIRNIDTFKYFEVLADDAELTVTDVTSTMRPFNFLPYMISYERASIRMFIVSRK